MKEIQKLVENTSIIMTEEPILSESSLEGAMIDLWHKVSVCEFDCTL